MKTIIASFALLATTLTASASDLPQLHLDFGNGVPGGFTSIIGQGRLSRAHAGFVFGVTPHVIRTTRWPLTVGRKGRLPVVRSVPPIDQEGAR